MVRRAKDDVMVSRPRRKIPAAIGVFAGIIILCAAPAHAAPPNTLIRATRFFTIRLERAGSTLCSTTARNTLSFLTRIGSSNQTGLNRTIACSDGTFRLQVDHHVTSTYNTSGTNSVTQHFRQEIRTITGVTCLRTWDLPLGITGTITGVEAMRWETHTGIGPQPCAGVPLDVSHIFDEGREVINGVT
jgi:hypothetical protein